MLHNLTVQSNDELRKRCERSACGVKGAWQGNELQVYITGPPTPSLAHPTLSLVPPTPSLAPPTTYLSRGSLMTADPGDGAKMALKVHAPSLPAGGVALALVHCLLLTPHHKLVHLVGGEGQTGGCYGLALATHKLHTLLRGGGAPIT